MAKRKKSFINTKGILFVAIITAAIFAIGAAYYAGQQSTENRSRASGRKDQGELKCKEGVNSMKSLQMCASNPSLYSKVRYKCYDGYTFDLGDSTSCKTLNEFDSVAKTNCIGHKKCLIPTPKEQKVCGGIAGVECSKGYTCKLDGAHPDASGVCIRDSRPSKTPLTPATGTRK